MATDLSFAVPSIIPQDLQLIQDILGDLPLTHVPQKAQQPLQEHTSSDDEHGTDSDTDSEKEVEAGILGDVEDGDGAPSESTSDSESSSDSDSEPGEGEAQKPRQRPPAEEDDEDGDLPATSEAHVRTKNELVDLDIAVPEISQIGPDERLEKVGEIMNIVNHVAIIKGVPSPIANRGSERALDSETLLVFEDRKVLGYIFETFGPTSEPLYQVKFNSKYPLDTERIQVGRPVFHVPEKSHYVFVQQLRHLKGSDASNVHDEEPGEDEVEFSDDEAEAAHKRAQTQRREQQRARSSSVVSSRHGTPVPSFMRDQDMVDDPYGGTSSTHDRSPTLSYSDSDYGAGPSRPAPVPYDDPYSDSYGLPPPEVEREKVEKSRPQASPPSSPRGHGRGRGRGGFQDRGRGRGRDRHHGDRGRGRGRGRGGGGDQRHSSGSWSRRQGPSEPQQPRSLSPTSLAIARATGQYSDGPAMDAQYDPTAGMGSGWGYQQYPTPQMQQSFDYSFGYQVPHVQPHINPRFAANFGMAGMGMGYGAYGGQSGPYSHDASGYSVGNAAGGWSGEEQWGPASEAPPNTEGRNQNA